MIKTSVLFIGASDWFLFQYIWNKIVLIVLQGTPEEAPWFALTLFIQNKNSWKTQLDKPCPFLHPETLEKVSAEMSQLGSRVFLWEQPLRNREDLSRPYCIVQSAWTFVVKPMATAGRGRNSENLLVLVTIWSKLQAWITPCCWNDSLEGQLNPTTTAFCFPFYNDSF